MDAAAVDMKELLSSSDSSSGEATSKSRNNDSGDSHASNCLRASTRIGSCNRNSDNNNNNNPCGSSVVVLTSPPGEALRYYVIVTRLMITPSSSEQAKTMLRSATALFAIDTSSGEVIHSATRDVFENEVEAVEELHKRHGLWSSASASSRASNAGASIKSEETSENSNNSSGATPTPQMHVSLSPSLSMLSSSTTLSSLSSSSPTQGSLLSSSPPTATSTLGQTNASSNTLNIVARGVGLCGYLVYGNIGYLLLVVKSEKTVELPSGDDIMTVRECQWVRINLRDPCRRLTKTDERVACNLLEMNLDAGNFYCETADVTRPFGSHSLSIDCEGTTNVESSQLASSEAEFVWNLHMAKSLRSCGLEKYCIVLVSGYAGEKLIPMMEDGTKASVTAIGNGEMKRVGSHHNNLDNSTLVHLCHIARRSSMHAGTRYLARGMNDCNEPGNEMECEQIVYRRTKSTSTIIGDESGNDSSTVKSKLLISIKFVSYMWRRGTVPIWWGQEIKNTGRIAYSCVSPFLIHVASE